MFFSKELAKACKARSGEKYQPSNGTEGMVFMEHFCNHCLRDENEDCEILMLTMLYDVDDPEYPKEWQYGKDGQPKCTAFIPLEEWRRQSLENEKHRGKEKGQMLLFEEDEQ